MLLTLFSSGGGLFGLQASCSGILEANNIFQFVVEQMSGSYTVLTDVGRGNHDVRTWHGFGETDDE